MSKKAKAKAVDRASATIRLATRTDAQKVNVARDVTASAKQNQGWATALDLQAATKVWNQAADELESQGSEIGQLKLQLANLETKQLGSRRAWRAGKKQTLGAVDVLCAGSADDLKAYGFEVLTRTSPGMAISPPDNLKTTPGKVIGEVVVSWPKGGGRHGFIVQHGTDVANAASYSAPIACTATKYTLKGGVSGSIVHFRVAAIDPSSETGQTAWSAWVSGTVR
jgi:hypothetical protein